MRVLLISDGRPGHYRQSEGVVAALRRRGPIELDRIELGMRSFMPRGLVPKVARLLPPSLFLRLVHGLDQVDLPKPSMIVSAGGMTLGANVGLARIWSIPNIFCGSTRGFPLDGFSLVLTPYASQGGRHNVVAAPKPTPFDPDGHPPPRALKTLDDMRGARVSVLVGGPTPYADFGTDDWARLGTLVEALVQEWSCVVTIVTSPRTPESAYDFLAPVADQFRGLVSLIDFRSVGPGSIEAALNCDLVLITSDSMSMMNEAALSRRPAIALAPQKVHPNRDDEAVAGLVASKWLAVLSLPAANARAIAGAAAGLTPIAENHLDRLAQVISDGPLPSATTVSRVRNVEPSPQATL